MDPVSDRVHNRGLKNRYIRIRMNMPCWPLLWQVVPCFPRMLNQVESYRQRQGRKLALATADSSVNRLLMPSLKGKTLTIIMCMAPREYLQGVQYQEGVREDVKSFLNRKLDWTHRKSMEANREWLSKGVSINRLTEGHHQEVALIYYSINRVSRGCSYINPNN